MVVDKVPQRHIFIDPHADLVETGFDTQFQPLRRHHRLGGGLGAGQFAGVSGIHMDVGEPLFQSGDLLHACGGDVAVKPAMGPVEQVSLSLGVADDIDTGHGTPSFSLVWVGVISPISCEAR